MSDLELARQTLESEALAFVIARDGRVIARGTESGVIELLATLDRIGAAAKGAVLADKVVGKAVAILVVNAGICAVDTAVASAAAVEMLKLHHVPLEARNVVPVIINRRGDDACPMEKATMPYLDPVEGLVRLRAFFAARDRA